MIKGKDSQVDQKVKNLSAVQETWVLSLGQEDPLERKMATYSSILAWRISQIEESGAGYSPWGRKESGMTEQLTHTQYIKSHPMEENTIIAKDCETHPQIIMILP